MNTDELSTGGVLPAAKSKKREGEKRKSPSTPLREKGKGKEGKPGADGTCLFARADAHVSRSLLRRHVNAAVEDALVAFCGDYKLVVKSRAGDAAGPLQTSFRKVKYLRVVDPEPVVNPPEITGVKSGDGPDGTVNLNGTLDVEGTNLETATAVELQDEHEVTFATVPATFADGKLTGTVSGVSGAPGIGYVKVTTSGGSDAYGVEYTGG